MEKEDHGASLAYAGFVDEQRRQALEELFRNAVADIPVALARSRCDEGGAVEPFVAVVAERGGPLPARGPDPAFDWLRSNAVLVRAE